MRESSEARVGGRSDILAVGFGATVAMWAVGYVGRLPGVSAPSWLLGILLLVCVFCAGIVAGRWTARGWRGGALSGALSGLLNLLVLGSLLSGPGLDHVAPSALWWVPGSLVASAALCGAGALVGSRGRPVGGIKPYWPGAFAKVAAAATFLLLLVGGLVTGNDAGLAVVDWPNSFGYNMFLYPLSRMTGGIYYEHAHRLFGSLVGLTTLVLALYLQRVDGRRWVRRFALIAVGVVILQGLLGGLRVTGHFTLSASRADVAPSITLAVVHGVVGQLFFSMMVALAVFTSRAWLADGARESRRSAKSDLLLTRILVGVLLVQLVLGAIQRHLDRGLLIHVTLAVVVVVVGLAVGVRASGRYRGVSPVDGLGRALLGLLAVQVTLGVLALFATLSLPPGQRPAEWQALLTTAHQGTGAVLLACAVALMLWSHRRLAPAPGGASAEAPTGVAPGQPS